MVDLRNIARFVRKKGLMVMLAVFEFLRELTKTILIVTRSISAFIEMLIAVYVPFLFVQ